MPRCLSLLIYLIAVLLLQVLPGYSQQYKTVHTSIAEGLSQSTIYDMAQDHEGYLWLATQDGLNRYDGRSFVVFREEPFDTTSLSSNYINTVLADSKGRLWVGTANQGLNVRLPGSNSFIRIKALDKSDETATNIISDLIEDAQGRIWIGTGGGLFRVDESTEKPEQGLRFTRIRMDIPGVGNLTEKFVNRITAVKKNQLWVATLNGAFQLHVNESNGSVRVLKWFGTANGMLSDKPVTAITYDHKGRIWLGGRNGIDIIGSNGEKIASLNTDSDAQQGMRDHNVNALFTSSDGKIWIGYYASGIQIADIRNSNDKITFLEPSVQKPLPILSNGNAVCFLEDHITKGIIWSGFFANGIVRFVPITKKFVTNHLSDLGSGETSFVVNLLRDPQNNVWIGTPSGLIQHNRNSGQYRVFHPSKLSGKLPHNDNYINGIVQARNGDIIFGSVDKLFQLESGTLKPVVITIPDTLSQGKNVFSNIFQDYAGRIFLIMRYKIYYFDPDHKALIPIIHARSESRLRDRSFHFTSCFADRSGNMWVGTSSGLELYMLKEGTDLEYNATPLVFRHNPSDTTSLRNHNVLCVNEDHDGNIWIGTMNGLTRVVGRNDSIRFINYSTRNGLMNNVIYSVVPDKRTGHLWLSTNNGLTEFHPRGYAIANYDIHDGLQSNEFNSYAYYQAPDGELFFGGIAGYTSFYPWQINTDKSAPLVSISGILLDGTTAREIIRNGQGKTINLKYRENSFTINFAGIHYTDPQKVHYEYKLEGFQEGWTDAGSTGTVNFSQLPPGSYKFHVKASNSDGVFNELGDVLLINIKPPFHKTVWFYLLLAGFVAGIIYTIFRYRLSMKMQKVKEVEQIRRATAADFHDELGHKLTIISWFAEILKKKIGPDQNELRPHLDRIIDASGNLYHTMKDMLWAMDPDKDSLYDLYSQIKEFGQELYDNTGIEFTAADIPNTFRGKILSPASKRHILLIFKEMMHNSLKHSGGNATALDLVQNNGHIIIRFRDNGKGFRLNGHSTGRGLDNVKRRAGQIHAGISIHSEEKGTVAELEIPENQLN